MIKAVICPTYLLVANSSLHQESKTKTTQAHIKNKWRFEMQKDVFSWLYNVGLAIQSAHIPSPCRFPYTVRLRPQKIWDDAGERL